MHDKKMSTADLQRGILSDDFSRGIISDLGYTNYPEAVQAEIISEVGEILLMRLTLEMAKKIPQEQGEALESLIGSGDMEALRKFVEPHLGDPDAFFRDTVQREYQLLKTKILSEQQIEDKKNAYTYL